MSASAGEILGTLRLNIADFEAGIAKAIALADRLDGKDVNVRVDVDSAGAETRLAAVAASEEKVDQGNVKVAKSGQDAGKGMGAMAAAIITLGPAIVPLAAATAGLAVGFGAMSAAGILAVVGIAQEMKAGSTLGLSYTAMLGTLKGNLTTLSQIAAAGVLQPFQVAVADLQTKMPPLNSIIGEFSIITGKTAGALTTGLVAAFISLAPLARDAGVYILTLSTRFAAMMSGPGVVTFGDYVRSVFPQVMQTVESVVTAAVRLVAALAPLGMGTLGMLKTLADVINALPVDVLATLATVASSVYIGFKSYGLLAVGIRGVGTALEVMGVSAKTAAAGMSALTIAAGVIGVLVAVAAFAFTAHSESVRKDQEAVNSLTDALIANGGAISDNTVKEQALKLAKDGTLAAAQAQGYAIADVTAASLGNADASARVAAHTKELEAAWISTASAGGDFTGTLQDAVPAVKMVTDATKDGTKNLALAVTAYEAYNAATAKAASGGNAAAAAQQAVAATAGTTAAALASATDGQKKTADAAANAAAKMYLENDAAGILKNSLDLLNGKALSAAQAQNSFDSSLVNMGDHVTATGGKVKFTTKSISDMSAASVSLRGQLNGQVTNLQQVVEANGGLANSTGKAREQMASMRTQIINNAVAHGVDRAAVTAYIDKLLKIPKKVPPTKLDVDKTSAETKIKTLQAQITAIKQGKVPGLTANSKAAQTVIKDLQAQIEALRQHKKPGLDANSAAGRAKIADLQRQINSLSGKTVSVSVRTNYVTIGKPAPQSVIPGFHVANGGIMGAFANGGIQRFAGGGENHVAQIAPAGAMRLWAEPETGGEAYIPLAPSKRARSTAIYDEVGKLFGKSGSATDMTGVRADLAVVAAEVRGLGDRFGSEIQRQARTIQTMQRQMA